MKIALSGTSSTGKTTLLNDLLLNRQIKEHVCQAAQIDTRSILTDMGLRADGFGCSSKSMREFQWRVLEEKQRSESKLASFITDRSYLDLAAYWVTRHNEHDQETADYIDRCIEAAATYTTHIFLPYGRIPFSEDSFRPSDPVFLSNVSNTISSQLTESNLPHMTLAEADRDKSVALILNYIQLS